MSLGWKYSGIIMDQTPTTHQPCIYILICCLICNSVMVITMSVDSMIDVTGSFLSDIHSKCRVGDGNFTSLLHAMGSTGYQDRMFSFSLD